MSNDLTHITVILDRSGSMSSIANDVVGGFNTFLAEQQQVGGQATLTLVQFDSQDPYELVADRQPISTIAPLDRGTYVPRGMTPLFDAVGQGITRLDTTLLALDKAARPARVVFVIITDGEENSSREFSYPMVRRLIEQHAEWQFLYLSSSLRAMDDASRMGIARDQSIAMPTDGRGMRDAWGISSASIRDFRSGVRQRAHIYEDERLRDDDPNRDAFLARPWSPQALAGQRVLVVGIGGGADAIAAYGLARYLQQTVGCDAHYGITVSGRDMSAVIEALRAGGAVDAHPHIWLLSGEPQPVGAVAPDDDSIAIARSLPHDGASGPLAIILPHHDADAKRALVESIDRLAVSHIIAVDAGGTTLMPQPDTADQQHRMLRVLRRATAPLTHAVVGPGASGAMHIGALLDVMRQRDRARRYGGCLPLQQLTPLIEPAAQQLAPDQPLAIALRAAHTPGDAPVRVPRGVQPTIPASWLGHIVFFRA